jgi:hypothetical protein
VREAVDDAAPVFAGVAEASGGEGKRSCRGERGEMLLM